MQNTATPAHSTDTFDQPLDDLRPSPHEHVAHFPLWDPTRETPLTSSAQPAQHTPSRSWLATLGLDTTYLFLGFVLALVHFIVIVTLLSLGVSTLILWIGVPILTTAFLYARGASLGERRQMARILDEPVATPQYREATGGFWSRLTSHWRDPQSWFEIIWVFVDFIVATACFCVAFTWWAGALATIGAPIALLVLREALGPDQIQGVGSWLGLGFNADLIINVIAGLLFAVTLPKIVHALAHFRAAVSQNLLCSFAEQIAETERITDSRNAVRRAGTDSLRRLERDIHDGPQQRLIRLNMDLARARRMAATDPERAQEVIADAMGQTQDTLSELRQLSRGIAPPVLVDRGLRAAVQELAGRSEIPIDVDVTTPRDLPEHVETVAYFAIAEAVANANKHSGAEHLQVRAALDDDVVVVTVTDDGRGGAAFAKGHGLVGLADRVNGADGELRVDSPTGGPTMVQAVIPCAY